MMKLKKLFRSCLPLLLAVALLAGTAQAALLEVGPTVPQVIGSTVPNLGHGYPSWYRDTNRVPLELCLNEAMCFFAPPDPAFPVSFPGNVPDELFYWAGDASIPLASGGNAILVQAIEAAYSTGGVVPGAQITFARIRIRVDTNVAGNYVVTTPFKQYTFNVTDIAAGINFTEDIGIGADGVFTGALTGSVGPFLYCTDAPFPATDGSGGSYIGKNAVACPVLGSTFIDPVTGQPANLFRVQGPAGFGGLPSGTVQTADFRVQGKLFTTVTPTPLTVDKATYVLDTTGLRLSAFATTQALSNQTGTGAFPLNFALGGVPSALQLSATGITAQAMTTNSPADGKFFATSGPVAAALPATVTVTNTADIPATVMTAPLVDEVVISTATYNSLTNVLAITASSADKVNAPALQAFMPGMTAPLGTLAAGVLNITFPVIDTTVTPNKTYAIPPNTITVISAKGGAATASVSTLTPVLPATAVTLTPSVPSPQLIGTPAVTFTAAATGGDAGPYQYRFYWRAPNTVNFTMGRPYSTAPTWTWDTSTLPAGTYTLMVYARHVGSLLDPEVRSIITYQIGAPVVPATAVTLTPSVLSPQLSGTPVTLTAAASGGDAGPYEYRFYWRAPNTVNFTMGRPYSTTPTWTWDTAGLGLPAGTYTLMVYTRHVGSPVDSEVKSIITFVLN